MRVCTCSVLMRAQRKSMGTAPLYLCASVHVCIYIYTGIYYLYIQITLCIHSNIIYVAGTFCTYAQAGTMYMYDTHVVHITQGLGACMYICIHSTMYL